MTTTSLLEISAKSAWVKATETTHFIRDFDPIITDEPPALGGQDKGINPVEAILTALNGCKGVVIPLIAKEQNFAFSALRFESRGSIDLKGLLGDPNVSTHFQTLGLDIFIETSESNEKLEQLKQTVASRCPVYNLLIDANIPVEVTWSRL